MRLQLTANSKTGKEVVAYEKMCTYKKGMLNNPNLRYALVCGEAAHVHG